MNYSIVIFAIVLLLCSQARIIAEGELIRFNFTAYGLRPGDFSNLYYEDARGEPTRLEFHRKQRSGEYEAEVFSDRRTLKFLQLTTVGSSDEQNQYSEVANVELEQIPEKLLLVFVPTKNPEQQYRVLPVSDSPSTADGGTIRIINLTSVTLLGMAEDKRFELPSLATSEPFRASGDDPAEFSIVAEGSSRYHLVYRNSLKLDSESRAILFLTPPYRKVSLKLGGQMLHEELGDRGE